MRISDWSSDVCSSDLPSPSAPRLRAGALFLAPILAFRPGLGDGFAELPRSWISRSGQRKGGRSLDPRSETRGHLLADRAGRPDGPQGRASCWEGGGEHALFAVVAV